ncbi:MAG: hypothetical protein ACLFNK_05610 [Candidatus Woesearchaeota archaeon]
MLVEKEKTKKNRWIPELDPYAYPKTSAFILTNIGYWMSGDNLKAAIENPSSILDNPLFAVTYPASLFFAYTVFRTLNKFSGPNRLRSFIRFTRLSGQLDSNKDDTTGDEETLEKICDCLQPSTYYHNHIRAMYHFNRKQKIEGIDELLRYARHSGRAEAALSTNPVTALSAGVAYGIAFLQDKIKGNLKTPESRMNARYNHILHLFNGGKITPLVSRAIDKLLQDAEGIEDKIAYGALKDYTRGPDDRNWKPFLQNLEENATGSSIENHLDDVTEGRNPVYRYPGIFLKKFTSKEALDTEMYNIKEVFKDVKHVLNHGVAADIAGEHYFIAPESGITLYDALEKMDIHEKELMTEQALRNLADIQIVAEKREVYQKVAADHHTERIRGLASFIDIDDALLDSWHELISLPLCTVDALYYKDSNPKNYLKEDDLLFEIDFEASVKKPFGLDLVNILEFERMEMNEYSDELIGYHIDILKRSGIETSLGPQEYALCKAQRHLELFGYRQRDFRRGMGPEQLSYAEYHAENTINALSELSENPYTNGRGYSDLASRVESAIKESL